MASRDVVVTCWLLNLVVCSVSSPVVKLAQGELRGVEGEAGEKHFYSIPYATAGRFEYPKPPPPWKGTLQATNLIDRCPQILPILIGREDCLSLDIHIPRGKDELKDRKLPVIVFFHGGAYYHGGKDMYHPLLLNYKDVIIVPINYRLSVLGFLCINDVSNIGLRDQVAALKWIQKNIQAFGGDPGNVTICGQSAGASAASMHLLSKKSRGLFHKAILASGTALSTWAYNIDKFSTTRADANKIAPAKTEGDIFRIFKEAPLDTLIRATRSSSGDTRNFRYSPCVDSNFTDPFFADTPHNILKSGDFNKVPVMIGHTDLEGMFFYPIERPNVKEINENFVNYLPSIFDCSKKDRHKIAERIRAHYFGNNTDENKNVINLVRFYSDWLAYGSSNAYSKLLVKYSDQPVYNYEFSYFGGRNFGHDLSSLNLKVTTHSDDMFYIFKPFGFNMGISQRDLKFANTYNTMIANFVKYGNPTPTKMQSRPLWPAATRASSNVMVLDETFQLLQEPKPEHQGGFFLDMLCQYGKEGYVPCTSDKLCRPRL